MNIKQENIVINVVFGIICLIILIFIILLIWYRFFKKDRANFVDNINRVSNPLYEKSSIDETSV